MDLNLIFDNFLVIFSILLPILAFWWLWLPLFLGIFAWRAFKMYTKSKYLSQLKWVLIEIRIPKNPNRSPKAMEQIFSNLYGIYIPVKHREAVWKGKIHDWFSLEIISTEGKIQFFIRAPEQYKNMVESQLYAQYPDVELYETQDYVNDLPAKLPDNQYDLWGADLALTKEDAYPIRTYEEFEDKSPNKEAPQRIDPMASMSELLGSLHTGEHLWIQILIRPTGDDWVKRAQKTMDKLLGKEPKKAPPNSIQKAFKSFESALPGPAAPAEKPKEDKKPELATGAHEAAKAIEESLGKFGHETSIRFVYIAPRESFHRAHIAGVMGVFKQFSSQNLNGFKLDRFSAPIATGIFKDRNNLRIKKFLIYRYRNRLLGFKPFVLNTEELATLYHFPDVGVRSPLLPRIEAKRGEPPQGLPII